MWPLDTAVKPIQHGCLWGIRPQVANRSVIAAVLVAMAGPARPAGAEPVATLPDPPATPRVVTVSPAAFRPSWDLDGIYLWLGPLGAASYVGARWDSMFGGEAAVVRVREREPIGAIGIDLGASRFTARDGGRVWVDGLIGTPLGGRMMGASLGPVIEISELAHPRLGGSIGVWGHAGIAPFVRVGAVAGTGMFAELGIHVPLPVLRR
jgi:hypothetical protein